MTTNHQAHYGSIKSTFLAFFLLIQSLAASHAFAETKHTELDDPALRGIVLLAASTGGDKLVRVDYKNGETSNIKAGDGGMLAIGVLWTRKQFELQSTLGYYADSAPASNGDASFTRLPIELMAFWRYKQFRIGGGITHHFNPKLRIDFDNINGNETVKYNNASGLIIQADYYYSDQFGVGLKLTDIDYKARQSNQKFDGNSVGVVGSYLF